MKIEARDVSFRYDKDDIFKNISFAVQKGGILSLLGPNGAGKSTLIRCLARVLCIKSGEIYIDGLNYRQLSNRQFAKKVAYIPQNEAPIFPFTVCDLVAMGRTPHKDFFALPDKADYNMVHRVLENLGISRLEYKRCTDLSGGERQMVLFAAAIVQEPEVLLLDEPTSHLDFGNQIKVLKIIKDLSDNGISIIMTTHAPEQAFLVGGHVAIMKNGDVLASGSPEDVITEKNISSAFGISVKIIDVDIEKKIKTCAVLLK